MKNKATICLWMAIVAAVISRAKYPEADNIIVGVYDGVEYTLSNFVYFTATDIVISCLILAVAIASNISLAWAIFLVSIGKIFDEFCSPFNLGPAETVVIATASLYYIYKLFIALYQNKCKT